MAGGKPEAEEQKLIAFLVDYDGCAVNKFELFNQQLIKSIIQIIRRNPDCKFKLLCFSQRQTATNEKHACQFYKADDMACKNLPMLVDIINQMLAERKIDANLEFDQTLVADFNEDLEPGTTHRDMLDIFAANALENTTVFNGSCPLATNDKAKILMTYAFIQYLAEYEVPVECHVYDDQTKAIIIPNKLFYTHGKGNKNPAFPDESTLHFVSTDPKEMLFKDYGSAKGSGKRDTNFRRTLLRLIILHGFNVDTLQYFRTGMINTQMDRQVYRAYPFDILRQDEFSSDDLDPAIFPNLEEKIERIKLIELIFTQIELAKTKKSELQLRDELLESLKDIWRLGLRCLRLRLTRLAELFFQHLKDLLELLFDPNQAERVSKINFLIIKVQINCMFAIKQINHAYVNKVDASTELTFNFQKALHKLHENVALCVRFNNIQVVAYQSFNELNLNEAKAEILVAVWIATCAYSKGGQPGISDILYTLLHKLSHLLAMGNSPAAANQTEGNLKQISLAITTAKSEINALLAATETLPLGIDIMQMLTNLHKALVGAQLSIQAMNRAASTTGTEPLAALPAGGEESPMSQHRMAN